MTDEELVDSKLYKQAKKIMGDQNLREFLKKGDQELKELIALNSVHIQEVIGKTKETDAYKKACAVKADFEGAMRESIKPHKVANELASVMLSLRKKSK